jgi:WD40 repeat protein
MMWTALTGSRQFTLDDFKGPIQWIAFSRDGTRFATASRDKRLMVWDSASGRRILNVQESKANVNTVAFNSAGTLLLTADVTGTASVWDARTGQLLSQYIQGASTMQQAQFSRDGNRVITRLDKSVMIWDTHADTRNPSDISAYLRCRVPFRIESEQLVPSSPDPDCAR